MSDSDERDEAPEPAFEEVAQDEISRQHERDGRALTTQLEEE